MKELLTKKNYWKNLGNYSYTIKKYFGGNMMNLLDKFRSNSGEITKKI